MTRINKVISLTSVTTAVYECEWQCKSSSFLFETQLKSGIFSWVTDSYIIFMSELILIPVANI